MPLDLHHPLPEPEPGPDDFGDEEHLALITALVKIFSRLDDTEGHEDGWTGS